MMKQFIQFQFESRQVANLQMDALLEAFDPNTIAAPALRDFCGAAEIRFNHAADGPHPVLDMKLRRFLRVLAQGWGPHAAPFFCEFESPFMLLYFTAQLDNFMVAEYAEGPDFVVRHRAKIDLLDLLERYGTAKGSFRNLARPNRRISRDSCEAAGQHRLKTASLVVAPVGIHANILNRV